MPAGGPIRDDAPRGRRKRSNELCCCGPALHLYGRLEAQTKALGARIDLTETIALRAIANTALSSAHQPSAIANGLGEASLELLYDKPKDCVALTATYQIHFSVDSQCGPCAVEIWTDGEVVSHHHCLSDDGYVTVSSVKLFTGEEYFTRIHGALGVRGVVTDCAGNTDEHRFTLPEP